MNCKKCFSQRISKRCFNCKRNSYYRRHRATVDWCIRCKTLTKVGKHSECRECLDNRGMKECKTCTDVKPTFPAFSKRQGVCRDCQNKARRRVTVALDEAKS
jgi:hypothetical protein